MKHINLFNSNSEYELYKNSSDYILPNVSFITSEKHIKYEPKLVVGKYKIGILSKKDISNFTYNIVDLGLPSGTLWADRNVGATSPEDCGATFAWGETDGYVAKKTYMTAEEICNLFNPFVESLGIILTPANLDETLAMIMNCTLEDLEAIDYDLYSVGFILPLEKCFRSDWSDYFDTIDGGNTFIKYNNNGLTVLQPEDDAATVNMGSDWRMPTRAEIEELKQHCDYETDSLDTLLYKFTSKINGNSITIPAPLEALDNNALIDDRYYRVWSRDLYTYRNNDQLAETCVYFNNSAGGLYEYRYIGLPVRGVKSK